MESPHILGAPVQNVVPWATWHPGFVHLECRVLQTTFYNLHFCAPLNRHAKRLTLDLSCTGGQENRPLPPPRHPHHPNQIDMFVRTGSTKFTLQSKLSDLHKYKNTKIVPVELKLKTITFCSVCHANILSTDVCWSTVIDSVGNPQLSVFVDKF